MHLLNDSDFIESVPFSIVKFHPNDVILKENEVSQDVYFILDGNVQVNTHVSGANNELLPGLARLSKGDFFGELSMFDGEPRSAEVIAVDECEVAKVDGSSMLSFMEKYPEKGYFVLRELFMNLVLRMRQNNLRTKTVLDLYLNEKQA
ncbi:Crp/Fnr family transcriptional regulator [Methylocucumis oryzae]|uniref:Crp/Fnr family transcriptional regulator n=1 Tax=Methylocucumis oryzae TaxID=1632867 RepID=UPI000697C420|nr:cyclic nucleotide-binding domain-containing protein [Methylocucumis oryzae]